MILSRTPFRVSLFGGGSDYPAWFREHGGKVLGMAIDKYCYISVRHLPPFFEHKHRIVYSKVELVKELRQIEHPAVRGVLSEMKVSDGLEIHHDADLPARSGLGSSSSFTVGLLNALHALNGSMVTREFLGKEAIRIEQDVLRENVGSQDQLWAAYGGLNTITFRTDSSISVTPLILTRKRRAELQGSLILFFTGFSRIASEIAKDKIENFKNRQSHVSRMAQMVDEALAILGSASRPIGEIGELLHESWRLKRDLAETVSTPQLDEIYAAGRSAGAIGGKLLGAGGGGFMLFFVAPEKRAALIDRLKDLIAVSFDVDHDGSKIVVYQPDGL